MEPRRRLPTIVIEDDQIVRVALACSRYTVVELQDLNDVLQFPWCCRNGYVVRNIGSNPQKSEFLHRRLMQAPKGQQVDHRNCDTLDNRRSNLRICSPSENRQNVNRRANNTSGYKGVVKLGNRWIAQIRCDGRKHYLGCFESPEGAARAYDAAAKQLHGKFARMNFADEGRQ